LKWLLDDDDDDGEEEKHGALAGLVHKIRESLEGVFEVRPRMRGPPRG